MKFIILLIVLIDSAFTSLVEKAPQESSTESLTEYVDPFIGTDETHIFSIWRMEAGTYPGAVAPHGMAQISPETSSKTDFLHGYYYSQDTIRRFSLVDHLSGWPNGSRGKITLMPGSIKSIKDLEDVEIKSSFSHQDERAEAGYYQVYLQDSKINAEFAALGRSAIGKFNFGKKDSQNVLAIEDYSSIDFFENNEISLSVKAGDFGMGKEYTINVHLVFDHDYKMVIDDKRKILVFDQDVINFKYGVSYTSSENAKENLFHEIPEWDLQMATQKSKALWEEELSRVKVEDDNKDKKTVFYTALYHASLIPLNATDVNRQFPGHLKNEALQAEDTHYIYFTPWDAFRTTYPLVNLIDPKKGRDYMRSMVRFYHAYGKLPEPEVMTSVFVSSMIADALAKGITDFDTETAYRALKEMMLEPPFFRQEIELYNSLGYVPYPSRYATTATMEFAFNKWSLGQIARFMNEEALADELEQQSFYYRNNYHPKERYFLSKNVDSTWAQASMYAEADKYNMSWMVPHNVQDLINLMGGEEAFAEHLEDIFINKHFVLDNECPMIFPYLFAHAGKPFKTSKWKNIIMNDFFNSSPGGIPGNDDWGTMSSWYIWGALGLFPVTPGTDELILTGPIFNKIVIQQSEERSLTIQANKLTEKNQYIASAELNGTELNQCFVGQNRLDGHDIIQIDMTSEQTEFGTEKKPYSLTTARPDFEIIDFTVKKVKDELGRTFQGDVRIANHGATGSFLLRLLAKQKEVYKEWVLIKEGQTLQDSFKFNLYHAGVYNIRLKDKAIEISVPEDQLSEDDKIYFEQPRIAPFIRKNEKVKLYCWIKNISSKVFEYQPSIYLNDVVVEELEMVALEPGEKVKITASLPPLTDVGIQKLKVGNSPAATFKVYEKSTQAVALHYTFDNDEVYVEDISGFQNHGTRILGVKYVPGVSGNGVQFVEKGYIKIDNSLSLDISDDEITILCWYKPGQEEGRSSLVTRGAHNMLKLNGKWQVKWAAGGWGRGQSSYNSKALEGTSDPAWLDTWTHLAGTRNSNNLAVFHNGVNVHTLPHKGKILTSEFEWRVGSNAEIPQNSTPKGVIDEVMIFAKALSEEEVKQIYEEKNSLR